MGKEAGYGDECKENRQTFGVVERGQESSSTHPEFVSIYGVT